MSELYGPLIGLIVLLALSGFFSSSETALMAISRHRIRQLERQGDRRASIVHKLVSRPDRLLSGVLLGNNFVNVAASALATMVALRLAGENGVVIATLVMTALILIFSEIAPKTYAARHPERLALLVAPSVRFVVAVLYPIASLAAWIADRILIPLGGRRREGPSMSRADIQGMVELGAEERVIARQQSRMLQGIFHLSETTIEDIMIPRTSMSAVAIDSEPDELIRLVRESGHTRLPVYRESLDDIVGILHAKDVLPYWNRVSELRIEALMRKPIYVPETASLESLLKLFRRHRQHLAVVIDEFAGVEGIVTLEDLLEEIVGEIADEHDPVAGPRTFELADGAVLVEGAYPLTDLNRRYGLDLLSHDSTTLAGLLMEISGDVPQPGDRMRHGGLVFEVRRGSRNRVDLVRIEGMRVATDS